MADIVLVTGGLLVAVLAVGALTYLLLGNVEMEWGTGTHPPDRDPEQ